MNHQHCRNITLAGNDISRIIYCETHNSYELMIGSLSLRLDEASFTGMCNLINDAQKVKLAMSHSKQSFDKLMRQIKRV